MDVENPKKLIKNKTKAFGTKAAEYKVNINKSVGSCTLMWWVEKYPYKIHVHPNLWMWPYLGLCIYDQVKNEDLL